VKKKLLLVALLAPALGAAACGGHNHLTAGWSESSRTYFDRQTVNPQAGDKKAMAGLDTQEAKIITKTHRANMSAKAQDYGSGSGVLVVTPQGEARTTAMPPPSVPAGQ
jgi:hypothetical protein